MIDSLRKILDEVSSTQDFTLLDPFRDSAEWGQIGVQDRVVLAKLFVKCGELELKEGKDGPLSTFELANQLAPKNSQLLLEQANAYALYDEMVTFPAGEHDDCVITLAGALQLHQRCPLNDDLSFDQDDDKEKPEMAVAGYVPQDNDFDEDDGLEALYDDGVEELG